MYKWFSPENSLRNHCVKKKLCHRNFLLHVKLNALSQTWISWTPRLCRRKLTVLTTFSSWTSTLLNLLCKSWFPQVWVKHVWLYLAFFLFIYSGHKYLSEINSHSYDFITLLLFVYVWWTTTIQLVLVYIALTRCFLISFLYTTD